MKDDQREGYRTAISQALEQTQKRETAPYDGVVGQLPDWMPNPLVGEFLAARGYLLAKGKHEDVLRWMEARKRLPKITEFQWIPYVPEEFEDKIDALVYIKELVDLGKENGILAYLGKGGFEITRGIVRNLHNKEISKKSRKGGRDALGRVIEEILNNHPSYTENMVRRELKKRVQEGVILSITEDIIEWIDDDRTIQSRKISILKDRVSRIKTKNI